MRRTLELRPAAQDTGAATHKYNNQDHSILTAMMVVDNIIEGRLNKSNLWEGNTEQDYHEDKQKPVEMPKAQQAGAA